MVGGGVGQESRRQGGSSEAALGIQAGAAGCSRDRHLVSLRPDSQVAVRGSPLMEDGEKFGLGGEPGGVM